jgi:hypothetical protein
MMQYRHIAPDSGMFCLNDDVGFSAEFAKMQSTAKIQSQGKHPIPLGKRTLKYRK